MRRLVMTFNKSAGIFTIKRPVVLTCELLRLGLPPSGAPSQAFPGFAHSVLYRHAWFMGLPLSRTPWGQNPVVFLSACVSLTPRTPTQHMRAGHRRDTRVSAVRLGAGSLWCCCVLGWSCPAQSRLLSPS